MVEKAFERCIFESSLLFWFVLQFWGGEWWGELAIILLILYNIPGGLPKVMRENCLCHPKSLGAAIQDMGHRVVSGDWQLVFWQLLIIVKENWSGSRLSQKQCLAWISCKDKLLCSCKDNLGKGGRVILSCYWKWRGKVNAMVDSLMHCATLINVSSFLSFLNVWTIVRLMQFAPAVLFLHNGPTVRIKPSFPPQFPIALLLL